MHYNSIQYALKVWLTSLLAIPHVYLLYYLITSGNGCFPVTGYTLLLIECMLISLPLGFAFMVVLEVICKTKLPLPIKKLIAFVTLELLLLLVFAFMINVTGDKVISWTSCFDLVVICSSTIAVCMALYKLKPLSSRPGYLNLLKKY